MTGNFDVFTDPGSLLYLYKRADPGVIANLAFIKVNEVSHSCVFSQLYIPDTLL
jgi:hypothetical protein